MKITFLENSLIVAGVYCLMFFTACDNVLYQGKTDNESKGKSKDRPFDYNKRYIYVFAVKKTDSMNKILDIDTLGLMCTTKVYSPDSLQNAMSWAYLKTISAGKFVLNETNQKVNNTVTGIQSTQEELFIHPARGQYEILEMCAFPYLHFPLYIGKEWNWDLEIGSHWCPGNIKWKGKSTEIFKHIYTVTGTTTIDVPAGKISCYKIHTETSSILGNSNADFYYSYEYGIVKMRYFPLDKTKIELSFIAGFDDINVFNSHSIFYKMYQPKYFEWNTGK